MTMRRQFLIPSFVPLLLLLLAAWFMRPTHSADPRKPHPHKGLLEPYELKPPKMNLDSAALAKLKKGQPVKQQDNSAGKAGGRGIVVQDVHAPAAVVMGRILDFDHYNKMVPNVAQCGNYATKRLANGDQELKTRYVLSMLGVKLEYFVRHVHRPASNTVVWTLDYDRNSDFDDCAGYWAVVPLDGKNGERSRVFYSIDLRIPSWIPGFVVNILNTQALTSATAWVKTQSEKEYAPTLKAKAQKEAAAAAAAAVATGAGALSGEKGADKPRRRRFGGGELWESFVEEFGDMIDTDKLAAKVEANAKRKAAKAAAKAKAKAKAQQQQQQQQQQQAAAGGGKGGEQDDARRLLIFLWVAVLAFGLLQLWRDMEEEERDRQPAAPKGQATATAARGRS